LVYWQAFSATEESGKAKYFYIVIWRFFMELKDSGAIAYSAEPQVLTISILKNDVIDILKSLANMKLIKLETDMSLKSESGFGDENPKIGFGCLKGQIWMADDFNAPLDCFKEYML
jgi:hypothetical protein